ncbi:hypothetical protein OIU85_004252 [Salix viminalis]|uniref:NAD(P)H-quinone oxidoreductase subunit N, chloroplastic n=1 Tax=Salix viminalis TaxID=40686 RepID=A0A9Q0SY00_SALVM|nr:hypothetical protein OIU85_004252 [Salix viminalis]
MGECRPRSISTANSSTPLSNCSSRVSVMAGSRNVMLLQGFIKNNKWLSDVEEHKALAIYPPHEGGYEGRYLNRLIRQGYYFLDLSARGLGDPETTLTKVHPAHLGKQPIARWYFPPEVDFRLEHLPPDAKGLVVWIIEAKVLSKAELQFLALLPTLRPNVRVVAECGNWRKLVWKPLKEIAGTNRRGGLTSYLRRQSGTRKCPASICYSSDLFFITCATQRQFRVETEDEADKQCLSSIPLQNSPIGHV